jgi:hypothetical protein
MDLRSDRAATFQAGCRLVFSVSPSQILKVKTYLENQEEHPRKRSFTEELQDLLRAHQLECEEKDLP